MANDHPIGPITARRLLDSMEFTENFDGDNVRRSGKSVYVGSGQQRRDGGASPVDRKLVVKLTARGDNEGWFQFEQVKWSDVEGKYVTVNNGATHEDMGEAIATGGQVEGGSGFAYVGDIVTLRPGTRKRDRSPKPHWEFTPDCKMMPVAVSATGGTGGDEETPATWVYTVFAQDGEQLLEGVAPMNQVPAVGEVLPGTKGYVYYELIGGIPTLKLGLVNEVPVSYLNGIYGVSLDGATNYADYNGVIDLVEEAFTPAAERLPVEWAIDFGADVALPGGGVNKVITVSGSVDVSGLTGGSADGQGFESVTDGVTTVNKTDGGIISFTDTSNSGTTLGVNFAVADNDPTATVTGTVDASGLEVGGVGGSDGASVWSRKIRLPSGTATGVRTLDDDNYSGRNLMFLIHPPFQGTEAAFDDESSGGTPVGRRIAELETTDNVIQAFTGVSIFIDVSDGYKLKIDVTSVPGADTWFHWTVFKGPRKTSTDITIT